MEAIRQFPFFAEVVGAWGGLTDDARGTISIFCLLVATATVAFVVGRGIRYLELKVTQTDKIWDDALFHALRKPAVVFVWLQGIFWASEVAYRYSEAEVFQYNGMLMRIGVVWLIGWTSIRFVREFEKIAVSPRVSKPMDLTTVSAVGKLARAVIILTTALIVMQTLGYSISGVLAFGGIGGIAVGFAAKDLLANFFGGAMVYMDRPFKVGDWIRSPEKNIEGTVEHIGWRLTTIRTFDKRPLYVPNSIFTTISVENPSRMSHRRIYEVVGIRYADVSVMGSITQKVHEMIESHEEIDADQLIMVNFEKFNASSLDFFIYCFTKTTNWAKFHVVKQDILLRISEIIAEHGAEVAFPTHTLHLADAATTGPLSAVTGKAQEESASGVGSLEPPRDSSRSNRAGSHSRSAHANTSADEKEPSEAELAQDRRLRQPDKGPLSADGQTGSDPAKKYDRQQQS